MKNYLSMVVVLLVCGLITSCQKEITEPDTPVNPPVTNPADSAVVLSNLVYFDEGAADTDTSAVSVINYDSRGRVTSYVTYEYYNGVPEIIDSSHYYYNGLDSLPFKSENREVGTPYVDTYFHFYDNSQRLIRDSVISLGNATPDVSVNTYTYITGKIIETWKDMPSGNISFTDTGYIDVDGHINKVVSEVYPTAQTPTSVFSYDDHPNPLSELNIRFSYSPIPSYTYDVVDEVRLSNNILSETTTDLLFDGSVNNTLFTYTYNANGYPATITNSEDNGQSYFQKLVFVYK